MCDYSLMEFPNRLAKEGEVLVVHRFRSGSLGLAAPADCDPARTAQKRGLWAAVKDILFLPEVPKTSAVCIPPGARLMLHEVPARLQKELSVQPLEQVQFVQLSANENQHRDGVRFGNGRILRLQDLTVGQHVEVIDLGNAEVEAPSQYDEGIPSFPGAGFGR